jgi:hypothetical protein
LIEIGEAYRRNNSGGATAPSRADGKESNDDATSRDPERKCICNKHPRGSLVVDIQTLGKLRWQSIRDAGAIQTPNSDGIKPELRFTRRAEVEVGAVAGCIDLGTGAVVPHVDFIDVLQLLVLVRVEELVDQVSDLVVDVCEGDRGAEDPATRDVLCESCCVRLNAVLSVLMDRGSSAWEGLN